jgi:antitoxin Phd
MVEIVWSLKMAVWQVQEAKTKLSEVIEEANTKGPQIITRHGAERAVILSIAEYRALTARKPVRRKSLAQLFAESPFRGLDLDFERDQDFGRDVEL